MTLTINIDEKKLLALREKAEREGKSVEKLFEKYVDSILEEGNVSVQNDNGNVKVLVTQKIRELHDLAGIKPTKDFDEMADYREHILRKHA